MQQKEQAEKIETQEGVIQQAEVEVTGAEAALSQVRHNLQAAYEIQAQAREQSMAQSRCWYEGSGIKYHVWLTCGQCGSAWISAALDFPPWLQSAS